MLGLCGVPLSPCEQLRLWWGRLRAQSNQRKSSARILGVCANLLIGKVLTQPLYILTLHIFLSVLILFLSHQIVTELNYL